MITALDLRMQGLKAIESVVEEEGEGIISYKGKPKYVVLPFEVYDEIIAARLDRAYEEVMCNVKNGKYESAKTHDEIDAHIAKLTEGAL